VDEPTSKDLIDGDRVFALQALNKYQVYRLTTPNGEDLAHSWNIDNLRKFFV
jgi:hypothetical protein